MTSEQERSGRPAPQPVLTVAAVARRLGVAPSTLRTWDRRYGLGPSAHTAGSHRRYGPDDLYRLTLMRGLTLEGVPPAEAAQIALSAPSRDAPGSGAGVPDGAGGGDRFVPVADGPPPVHALDEGAVRDRPVAGRDLAGRLFGLADVPGLLPVGHEPSVRPLTPAAGDSGRGSAVWITEGRLPGAPRAVPPSEDLQVGDALLGAQALLGPAGPVTSAAPLGPLAPVGPGAPAGPRPWNRPAPAGVAGRAGGGRVLSLPDASPRARGLARAAMALDTLELTRLLRDAMTAHGVAGAWESMVSPVLRGLGQRWRATGEGVDVEHAFCEAVLFALRGVTATLHRPRNVVPVLLAGADGDFHSLPLHVLAAALAEEGVGCRMLGAGLPSAALVAASRRTGPAVVLVYARLPVADPRVLRELPRQRPAPRVLVGGPGWDDVMLPATVTPVRSLTEAVTVVLEAARV